MVSAGRSVGKSVDRASVKHKCDIKDLESYLPKALIKSTDNKCIDNSIYFSAPPGIPALPGLHRVLVTRVIWASSTVKGRMEISPRRWFRLTHVVVVTFALFIVFNIYGISKDKNPLRLMNIYSTEDRASVAQQRTLTEKTFQGLDQDDPALVTYIKHLINSPTNKPYNLSEPQKIHFSQFGQSSYADADILNGMKDGFFVEVGAVDGEYLSNSLYFERNRGWTGLLIEPFPETYKQLLSKQRKAYSINAALALNNVSSDVIFSPSGPKGVLGQIGNSTSAIKVKAFPLYSILLALNVTVVDFFSLDIEGVEMKVLKTVPWEKITFRLMCVEINHVPEGPKVLIEYMKSQGYKFLGIKGIDAWFGWPKLLKQTMKKI